MKTLLLLGIVTFAVLSSAPVRADGKSPAARQVDKAACLEAVSKGQVLREAHKLVEARDQFRVCARAECPAVVRADCTSWVVEVETALPTVVITAKNEAGRDLFDVDVSAEGQPLVSKLDGQAVPMNPGIHAMKFETADGASLEQKIVVKEGVKNQDVAVILHTRKSPAGAVGATLPTSPPAGANEAPAADEAVPSVPAQANEGGGSSAWRTVGWVATAVGVAGLGVGTAFGVVAISDKSSAHCDSSNACDAGPLNDAKSAATVSTVGLIAGGALLAGGVALVLSAPKGDKPEARAASLKLAPLVGARDGGLPLAGTW